MATLFEVYKDACKKLENKQKDEINIRMLLCSNNGIKSMSEFFVKKDENIKDLQRFNSDLSRFLEGEPIQYILGESEFFGSTFLVDKRVLIPRQETEEVALYALRKIMRVFPNKKVTLADICCGSGCIGISLAKHLELDGLFLSDISKEACEVAVENIARNQLTGYVLNGDGLKPLIKNGIKVDVIVCNPPYILNKKDVHPSVLKYEPHNALFIDNDLSIYKSILLDAFEVMNDKLLIIFEIGYDLKDKLIKLLQEININCEFTFTKDINDKYRIFSLLLERKIEV